MKRGLFLVGILGFLLGAFVIILSFNSLTGFTIVENVSRSAISIAGLTLIIGGLLICMQGSRNEPLEGRIRTENGKEREITFEILGDEKDDIPKNHLNDPQRQSRWKRIGKTVFSSPGRIAIAGIGAAELTHYTVGDNLYNAGKEGEHILKMARVISKVKNMPLPQAYELAKKTATQSLEQAQQSSLQLPTVNKENPLIDAKTRVYTFLRNQFKPEKKDENTLRATPEYQKNYSDLSKMRTLSLEKMAEEQPGTKEHETLNQYFTALKELDVKTIHEGNANPKYREIIRHGREDLKLREDNLSYLGTGLDVAASFAAAGVAIYAERKATKYARQIKGIYNWITGKKNEKQQ